MRLGLGLKLTQRRGGFASTPPPGTANLLAYYEAGVNTTLSGSPATNYGKIDSWLPKAGTGGLAQVTDANRLRLRSAGGTKVVYSWTKETSRTMADSVLVIDKQDCSAFVLVELGILMANASASSQTLISLPGGVGELYVYKGVGNYFKVAWKDGTGTYVSSLMPASSLNLIGVTLSSGAVVVHCNGQSETLAAAALSAGTVTGFRLNYGTLAYGEMTGYNAIVIYDHALDAGELAEVEEWGKGRAVYITDEAVTQHLFMSGASRACCYYSHLDHGRGLALEGKRLFGYCGFPGVTIDNAYNISRPILGHGSALGTGFNRPDKNQVVILESPTADIAADGVEATIIANMTSLRQTLRARGYFVVHNAMPPATGWSPSVLTKMTNLNAAMAALDSRRYGIHCSTPTELSDPTDLNFFDADGLHYVDAGTDVLKASNKPHVDTYFAKTITSVKGKYEFNGSLLDTSGYERDLIAINSPTYASGLNSKQCLVCTSTGNNAAKSWHSGREMDSLPLTVFGWFKPDSNGVNVNFVRKTSSAGGSKNWYIYRHSGGTVRAAMNDAGAEINSGGSYTAGNWYFAAIVISAGYGIKLYLSTAGGDASTAALAGQSAWTSGAVTPVTSSGFLRWGNDGDTSCSNVSIQGGEVRFEEMSLAQLQALTP